MYDKFLSSLVECCSVSCESARNKRQSSSSVTFKMTEIRDGKNLRVAAIRRSATIRPTADGRVGDDANGRVVMVSWWLLPRKVSVVDPGNFVDPTTRSLARLASPFPFLSLYLPLMGKTFQLFTPG